MTRALRRLAAVAIAAYLLTGAWIASSIAAYLHLPFGAVLASGALAVLLLPLLWEAWAPDPRAKPGARPPRLGFFGRWLVRALVLNTLLVGGVFGWAADDAFLALSTRGDWMLDGRAGPLADGARRALFGSADLLARAHHELRGSPFAALVDDRGPPPPAKVGTATTAAAVPRATPAVVERTPPSKVAEPNAQPEPPPAHVTVAWPLPEVLHPNVKALRPEEETSVPELARALVRGVDDPVERVKVLHDWVADRIAYDVDAWLAHRYPPQDADTVLARRTAVCAGYANLFAALGRAVGMEVSVVVGDARVAGRALEGTGHAWSAVQIGEARYLLDVTWDAGSVEGARFVKRYSTAFFLVPPAIMVASHLPKDPAWQLLPEPLGAGEFYRQPMLQPRFHALGLRLVSPARSQVESAGPVDLVLDNPQRRFVKGRFGLKGATSADVVPAAECSVTGTDRLTLTCPLDAPGTYRVQLFGSPVQFGVYDYVGEVEVNRT